MNTPAEQTYRSPTKALRRSARKNPNVTPKKLFADEEPEPKPPVAGDADASPPLKTTDSVGSREPDDDFPIRESLEKARTRHGLDVFINIGTKHFEAEAHRKRMKEMRLGLYEVQETEWRYPKVDDLLGNN